VALKLRNAAGATVSRNFYWLSSREPADYRPLSSLPPVKLNTAYEVARSEPESAVRVRVENPTDRIALFVHLVLSRSRDGEEVLPVFWDDNYFSLLPHETREVTARLATSALGAQKPALEVGGWNVETPYLCCDLKASRAELKINEKLTVVARIAGTFLDGSRVALLVDGRTADAKWTWARGDRTDEVVFDASFAEPGKHTLSIGSQSVTVNVKP
jgi:hypothetical protein